MGVANPPVADASFGLRRQMAFRGRLPAMNQPPQVAPLLAPTSRERYVRPPWSVEVRAERGRVRRRQEDAWAVLFAAAFGNRSVDCFAVFDGLGGLPFGDVAAHVAARNLKRALAAGDAPPGPLGRLNQQVLSTGGATTALVATFAEENGSAVGWIHSAGDSTAYRVDPLGRLWRLTPRDSFSAHRVTDYLGAPALRGHRIGCRLEPGEALLLCTDGVDGVLTADEAARALAARPVNGEGALDRAFDLIDLRGGPDNATVLLARWTGPVHAASPRATNGLQREGRP